MKTILIISFSIISLIFYFSCKENSPVSPIYDKHNIQNDSNWVEIIDTMIIIPNCMYDNSPQPPYIINDSNEYKSILLDSCFVGRRPWVDFSKRTVLGNVTQTNVTDFKYQIFKDDKLKLILYLIEIDVVYNFGFVSKLHLISIPKISNDYKVYFDTLHFHVP
ncbi:MAG: hypothetical protein ABSG15_12890 [FCB group bacterium]|jgi:hypothetical protein